MITPLFTRGALLLAALSLIPPLARAQTGGVIHTFDVPAPALRGNLVGDPAVRRTSIYFPAAYTQNPHRRFPVLYLLHGFGADNRAYIAGVYSNLDIRLSMDSLIAAGKVKPMIVVTPNARNRFDGSFYVNSPVTGRWEDFITHDLITYVDRHFRTIPSRRARGLAGHSMGGYGTLYIGMRHPDLFAAIYALSPCCLDVNTHTTPNMLRAWRKALQVHDTAGIRPAGFLADLLLALSAVYSPDTARAPLYVDMPYALRNDSLIADSVVATRWQPPLHMVDRYAMNLRRLRIGFDAGRQDGFPDIPRNVEALDAKLNALGVSHYVELYDGDHVNGVRRRIETMVLPFFSAALSFK